MFQREIEAIEPKEVREEAMQITTSWKEEGIEEGIKQGLAQGIQQGATRTALRQLRHKFNTLSPEVETRITALTALDLEDLSEALLDFQSLDELTAWLDTRVTGSANY